MKTRIVYQRVACPECHEARVDEPTTRLSPSAREHLAQARAALARPSDRRSA